jgi:hypothetical protein
VATRYSDWHPTFAYIWCFYVGILQGFDEDVITLLKVFFFEDDLALGANIFFLQPLLDAQEMIEVAARKQGTLFISFVEHFEADDTFLNVVEVRLKHHDFFVVLTWEVEI